MVDTLVATETSLAYSIFSKQSMRLAVNGLFSRKDWTYEKLFIMNIYNPHM